MSEIVYDFPSINRILNRRTQIEAAKVEEPQPAAPQVQSPWIYGGPIAPSAAPSSIHLHDALRKHHCPPLFKATPAECDLLNDEGRQALANINAKYQALTNLEKAQYWFVANGYGNL